MKLNLKNPIVFFDLETTGTNINTCLLYTSFPLPYYNGDKKANIEERNWKHDNLFTKQHYYTLLFDKEEDMDLVGDTSLTSVQVEWIFVKTRMMKKYYFGYLLLYLLISVGCIYPANYAEQKINEAYDTILHADKVTAEMIPALCNLSLIHI